MFVKNFSFARTVERTTAAGLEYGGIRYRHLEMLPVGVVMCGC